jgi:hypothetical protein
MQARRQREEKDRGSENEWFRMGERSEWFRKDSGREGEWLDK